MIPNFKQAAQQLTKLVRSFPVEAGNEAVNYFHSSFDSESWEGRAWKQREINLLEKNRGRRNLLVKSGRLKRSIRRVENGIGYVKVATDVPYAQAHNEGATIIQTPTAKQRAFFSHVAEGFFDSKNNENMWKQGHKFMAMSKAKQLKIVLPARQFMGNSPELEFKIQTKLQNKFQGAIALVVSRW